MGYIEEKHETEIMFKKILRNRRRRGKEFFGSNGCYLSPNHLTGTSPPKIKDMAKKPKITPIQLRIEFSTPPSIYIMNQVKTKKNQKNGTIKKSKGSKSSKN